MKLKKYKRLELLLAILVLLGFLACGTPGVYIGAMLRNGTLRYDKIMKYTKVAEGILLLLAVMLVIVRLRFWRCPHCHAYLGRWRGLGIPDYCPHCGEPLNEDD